MFKKLLIVPVITLAFMGLSATPVSAEHADQGLQAHCADHNGHPGKVNNPAFPSTTTKTVDGTTVNVNVSSNGKSVSFTDANGDPIKVEFCIKAAELAGGKQTGTSGSVTWKNHGGQTPDTSYVLVYGIAKDDNGNGDEQPENGDDNGHVLGGSTDAPAKLPTVGSPVAAAVTLFGAVTAGTMIIRSTFSRFFARG